MFADVCGLYPDLQCLKSKANCKDAIAFALQYASPGPDMPTGDNFDAWADKMMGQLKDECESKGVKVDGSGSGSEANGAVHIMQGASLVAVVAWVLAMFS